LAENIKLINEKIFQAQKGPFQKKRPDSSVTALPVSYLLTPLDLEFKALNKINDASSRR
jgi:hypothetical protein